jgi:hypothetical protein
MPVRVQLQRSEGSPVSEDALTIVVNSHGGLIPLAMKVTIGQLLTIENRKTREELTCRVVFVGSSHSGKAEVGIEFMKPAPRFWGMSFPPDDWTPRSPDAKGSD